MTEDQWQELKAATHEDPTAGSPQLSQPLRSRQRAAMDMAQRALRIIARLSSEIPTTSHLAANEAFRLIEEKARKTLRDIAAILPEATK